MSKKCECIAKLMVGAVGMGFVAAAFAQGASIDEITDLNRQKVIAELRKQVDAAKGVDKPMVDIVREPVIKSSKVQAEEPIEYAPDVHSIFGPRPDQLLAVISVAGGRQVRVRTGDVTAGGWEVEKITTSAVVFRKEHKATQTKGAQQSASGQYKRVTVGLSNYQRPSSASSAPTPMFPPVAMPVPGMGYGAQAGAQQSPLVVQLPPVAPSLPMQAK